MRKEQQTIPSRKVVCRSVGMSCILGALGGFHGHVFQMLMLVTAQ